MKLCNTVFCPLGKNGCQLMPGEFLPQFFTVIGKGQQDVLIPLGWLQWTTYHPTTSLWKMPPSWHWTGHSGVWRTGGYWQQVELCAETVQAKQWCDDECFDTVG